MEEKAQQPATQMRKSVERIHVPHVCVLAFTSGLACQRYDSIRSPNRLHSRAAAWHS